MYKLIILLLPFIIGCSSMSEREKAWHIIHAVDVAQTYQMTKSPCHKEIDLITSKVIGEHPSGDDVIIWGIANSLIYHYLDDVMPETILNAQFVFKIGAVESNYFHGLTPSRYSC